MNEHSRISEDDYMRSLQEYRNRFLNGSKTAGFYIQLAFVVGAVGIIATKGVWNVMWTVLVALPLVSKHSLTNHWSGFSTKPFEAVPFAV